VNSKETPYAPSRSHPTECGQNYQHTQFPSPLPQFEESRYDFSPISEQKPQVL